MIELASNFLCGAYCPLVVPFKDGEIDFDLYAKLAERQIAEGSHGLLVNATSGEPTTLTLEERAKVVEIAVDVSSGRAPVVAGTASQSHAETATLIERFNNIGADAILVVTPYYCMPPQRGMVEYYADLGQRTDRPLLTYHIPGRAGVSLTVDTLEAIVERVPHFVGMKNTDTDLGLVTGVLERLGPKFRIFAGLEQPSLPMMAVGAQGTMLALSNVVPRKVADLYEASAKGDMAGAQKLNIELHEIGSALFFDSGPIPAKYMMKRLGLLPQNEHRLPMVPATPELEQRLDKVLQRAGLV